MARCGGEASKDFGLGTVGASGEQTAHSALNKSERRRRNEGEPLEQQFYNLTLVNQTLLSVVFFVFFNIKL